VLSQCGRGDLKYMRRLLQRMWPHRVLVFAAVAAMVVGAVLQLAQPWLTKAAIDECVLRSDRHGVSLIAAKLLAALVLSFCAQAVYTYLTQLLGQRILAGLRVEIYASIQAQPVAYFDSTPVGRSIALLTSDVDALNDLYTTGIVSVLATVASLVGNGVALTVIDHKAALTVLLVFPVIVALTRWFRRRALDSYRRSRAHMAGIAARLQEDLSGAATVRLFRQESARFDLFARQNRLYRDATIDSVIYYAVFYPAIEFVSALATALVLWTSGWAVIRETLTLGGLVAALQYTARVFQPITDLAEKFDLFQAAMAACERIFGVLDRKPECPSPIAPRAVSRAGCRGSIVFERVSFGYSPQTLVVRDLSFEVRPGERVAIVGATGAGKSTIINLLLRFYKPGQGRILLDGSDIAEYDLRQLRRLFGLVLQETYVVAGSVAANIRLNDPSISDDRVLAAIRAVGADRFIDRLPRGLESVLAEGGPTLSAGEKQLLSLARAFAFDRPIMVLDEATSNLDTESEASVRNAVRVLMSGRTTFAIAHRLSTIQDFDKILVLRSGLLHETGDAFPVARRWRRVLQVMAIAARWTSASEWLRPREYRLGRSRSMIVERSFSDEPIQTPDFLFEMGKQMLFSAI
jgi:ATP-binding cassette subfamily B multidrug efflux pump